MDTATLVENQIDDGQKLIQQLARDGFDVAAACWVKPSEEGQWLLYVVSRFVDEKGLAAAYRAVHPALQRIPDPWLSLSELKLVGPTNPIAVDILDIQRRYPGRFPTRTRTPQLGGMSIEEAYIYPPVSAEADERWRGIEIMVFHEPGPANAYRVEFWPHELQAAIGPGGQPRRVPRPAGVRVEGGQVTEYRPPEKPLPHLRQSDYEMKALEAVRQQVANSD